MWLAMYTAPFKIPRHVLTQVQTLYMVLFSDLLCVCVCVCVSTSEFHTPMKQQLKYRIIGRKYADSPEYDQSGVADSWQSVATQFGQ